MSAFRPSLRLFAAHGFQQNAAPTTRRAASTATAPHAWAQPHYSHKERIHRFVPTESYPLIVAVLCMSAYAVYNAAHAFDRPEGELRLAPGRYRSRRSGPEPWEDPRALEGRW